ncbi:E3 ubiquitin-protein ligase RNF182-like, partial [Heteronotia binoei]|uniref:E3 ubiquitin-protein ligase RNF182-like n=1 Tax=Heteronotia binoei TaxID=13085 RepID=UPI00292F612A
MSSPPPPRECRICYEAFDGAGRRPQLLSCQHRVCAGCLRRLAAEEASGGHSPGGNRRLRCPFCRRESLLLPLLPPDGDEEAPSAPEVLLCPGLLQRPLPGSSACLVLTLLEVPQELAAPPGLGLRDVVRLYRPPSPAPLAASWRALPRRLLALLYFSSLPLGIYLLLLRRLALGLALGSLVPATLLVCEFPAL